jgi:hypothetical protein
MMTRDFANRYIASGFSVFPIKARSKDPATRHGFNDASADPSVIASWFDDFSDFNIGVVTGHISGLIVVDIDPRNGGDVSFARLVADVGPLPKTLKVKTGGGGFHLYFRAPDDLKTIHKLKAYPGIDVQFDGKYVVAPPSVHPSGALYEWEGGFADAEAVLTDLPPALRSLLEAAPAAKPKTTRKSASDRSVSPRHGAAGSGDPAWEPIRIACDALRTWSEQETDLSEPEWYALAGILAHCEDGFEIFHEISAADPRYCEQETEAKLEQAKTASAPRLCTSIEQEGGNCSDCPFRGRINSPIAFGNGSAALAEIQRGQTYIASRDSYLDLTDLDARAVLTLLKGPAFDAMYSHRLKAPATSLDNSSLTAKFKSMTYLPGQSRFMEDVLNLWQPSNMQPKSGGARAVMDLMESLFPAQPERDQVLDVLGFHIQNPAVQIKHALMVRGTQGSGKNTLFDAILGRIIGRANLRVVGGDALVSRFTAELSYCQVLVCNEVAHAESRAAYNRLKSVISEDVMLFEEKGVKLDHRNCPRLTIILSNIETPLPLEVGDRRFFVPEYGDLLPSSDLLDAIYGDIDGLAAEFLGVLLSRDVGHFDPTRPPPMTSAKEVITASVRPPLERQIIAMIDSELCPFDKDVVLVSRVRTALDLAGFRDVTDESVKRALKSLGATTGGQLPLRDQAGGWRGRPRYWVIRNFGLWEDRTPSEIADHLLGQSSLTRLTDTELAQLLSGSASGSPADGVAPSFGSIQ